MSSQDLRRGFEAMISENAWRQLISDGVRRTYRRGEHLILQGHRGSSLLLLTAGRSMVMCSDQTGSSCLLALRGPGDLLGELAGHTDGIRSASVVAMESSEAYSLGATAFHRALALLRLHGQFDRYLVGKLHEAGAATVNAAHALPLKRLARLLLQIIDIAGPQHPNPCHIPVSQMQLAEALHLSRSLICRHVAYLRAEGVLRVERGLVVENCSRLRAIESAPDEHATAG
jgi:CRP/FNR family transcriptional regulator, cyclic AMP receptor protein